MSLHAQDSSAHHQFRQSEHRQRVIAAFNCYNDGMFVFAYKRIWGWASPAWSVLPHTLKKLYRHAVIEHVKDSYYWNGSGWSFFETTTLTIEIQYSHNCDLMTDLTIVGSINGTIVENHYGCETSEFTKDFADWITHTDPMGGTGHDDLVPRAGSIGGYVAKVLSCSESSMVSELRSVDENGLNSLITTTVTLSDPVEPASIISELAEMLATVPLQRTSQPVTASPFLGGSETAGNIGFRTVGASPFLGNSVYLYYDEDCCESALKMKYATVGGIPGVSTSDFNCGCGDDNSPVMVQDRRQTYSPAWFDYTLATTGEVGDGTMFVADDPNWIYGITGGWVFSPGPGTWSFAIDSLFFSHEASGQAKKSLLGRTYPDDWTAMFLRDEDDEYIDPATCLDTDTDECLRYYYPTGADAGGSGPNSKNFVLTGRGEIIRRLVLKTIIIEPFTCTYGGTCPEGEEVGLPLANPC